MPVRGYTPSYKNESPYRFTPIMGNYMAYYIHRQINPQKDDILVEMTDQRYVNRPDLLAADLYSDADLWWVFGVRNGWEDPIHDMKLGVQFFVPSQSYLRDAL